MQMDIQPHANAALHPAIQHRRPAGQRDRKDIWEKRKISCSIRGFFQHHEHPIYVKISINFMFVVL
jgi:hypothetical protein